MPLSIEGRIKAIDTGVNKFSDFTFLPVAERFTGTKGSFPPKQVIMLTCILNGVSDIDLVAARLNIEPISIKTSINKIRNDVIGIIVGNDSLANILGHSNIFEHADAVRQQLIDQGFFVEKSE